MHRPPRPSGRVSPPRHRRRIVTAALGVLALAAGAVAAAAPASATSGPAHARGNLHAAVQSDQGVLVDGWAVTSDLSVPAQVVVTVDGTQAGTPLTASKYWPHPPRHPEYGNHHGFKRRIPTHAGSHEICAFVIDYPGTSQLPLGCVTVAVDNPYGRLDKVRRTPGYVTLIGWTIDPDDPTQSLTVNVLRDGQPAGTGIAHDPRDDVAAKHRRAGPDHGFSVRVRMPAGRHTLCVDAVNEGDGADTTLACATRTVDYSPSGLISGIRQAPDGVRVTGWALDPDTTDPVQVTITAGDGVVLGTGTADGTHGTHPGHGYNLTFPMPRPNVRPGSHWICAIAENAGQFGHSRKIGCAHKELNYNPRIRLDDVTQYGSGARIRGWAADPDVTGAIQVMITADGVKQKTISAGRTNSLHPHGHAFSTVVRLPDGQHTLCAIAINAGYGSANSAPRCDSVTLDFAPYGRFESVQHTHDGTKLHLRGWAIDPNTRKPIDVNVTVDGHRAGTWSADVPRAWVAQQHPGTGPAHGFLINTAADDGEHRVCVTAVNVGAGRGNKHFPCRVLNALHPKVASAPRNVSAQAGYGGARVRWSAPQTDGGAPWTSYTVTSSPGNVHVTVGRSTTAVTVLGLEPKTRYRFHVVANNIVGASPSGTSNSTRTQAQPPAQNTPAPISTSRYIRNIVDASKSERAMMHREGVADAKANPSGHGYLILLDIGGQDDRDRGVVLSAGVRFVTYSTLVKDVRAYVAGYASAQRPSAPVTIAIGTNNDMDVTATTGRHWADLVVDPVVKYAAQFPGVTIAGANDIEPGFRASYAQSSHWLNGYLHATRAPFVFNGSADGCSWTTPGRGCNNGWQMSGLFHLAGGASPIRIVNLPQIYNDTMAQQWRYISLTGVNSGHPRINFGGALTEWTACHQAGGCGSLTGNSAWTQMWKQLRAEPKLRISSLPYSTDLRIDR